MNINPIKSIFSVNCTNIKPAVSFRSINSSDTFEKSNQKRENPAIKWFEENDYVRKNLINTLRNPVNKKSTGSAHTGYAIPENNEFFLRTKIVEIPDAKIRDYEIIDTEDQNLKINIGQQVALIHLKDKEFQRCPFVEILKRQPGHHIGVKPSSTIYEEDGTLKQGELPYDDISRKEEYESTIQKVAQLPVEAFEKLLDDIKFAEDKGYTFDHLNSNNVRFDTENKTLSLIDMEKGSTKTDCASILYSITNIYYFNTFKSKNNAPVSDDRINNAIGNTIEIINKFTTAMKNKNLKFDKNNCRVEGMDMILSLPFSFFCKTLDFNEKWAKLEEMGLA